jgi:hypothetical protein
MSHSASEAPLLTTAEPPAEAKPPGVLGKMKRFFSGLFK